jgi:hypothetical protein
MMKLPLICALGAALLAAMPGRAADDLAGIFHRYEVDAATIPPALIESALKHFDCSAETIRSGVVGYQLSEAAAIWDIPCAVLAYNATHVLALVHVERPHEHYAFIKLPAAPGRTRDDDFVIIDPQWNVEKRTVSSFARGRGQGDCGTYEVFKSDAGSLALVELREKPVCDGKVVPPTRFPVVFPKKR